MINPAAYEWLQADIYSCVLLDLMIDHSLADLFGNILDRIHPGTTYTLQGVFGLLANLGITNGVEEVVPIPRRACDQNGNTSRTQLTVGF